MITVKILQARIESLKSELNSGTWPTLEGFIKGKIAAFEEVIRDIDTNQNN
jgi:hypothetical protein